MVVVVVVDLCLLRPGAGVPKSSGVTKVVAGVEKNIPESPVISSRDPICKFAGRPKAELVPILTPLIPCPWPRIWLARTGRLVVLRVLGVVVLAVVLRVVVGGENCCGVIVPPKKGACVVEPAKKLG